MTDFFLIFFFPDNELTTINLYKLFNFCQSSQHNNKESGMQSTKEAICLR
jgi:hypothetical protein